VRSDPDLAEAHYKLGNAFSQMPGRMPDAMAEYQAAWSAANRPAAQ
jgi:hypothetical protein